jgi:hypothetical protein
LGEDATPPRAIDPLDRVAELLDSEVGLEFGWQTPILGRAYAVMRAMLHEESRHYVDALMARQAEIDAALLAAIADLRRDVAKLRARMHESGGESSTTKP